MALGPADAGPVSGAVDSAVIARRIDKRFQQRQGLVETRQPVRADAALAWRQYLRAEIGAVAVRQDQEAAVIGDEFEPAVLVPEIPPDPLGRARRT